MKPTLKSRAEINIIKPKGQENRSMTRSSLLERIRKIDNPLDRLIKTKRSKDPNKQNHE